MTANPIWYEPKIGLKQRRQAERRAKVKELYEMGFANQEIADKLGCSVSSITGDVTAMGIANRMSGATARTYNPVNAMSTLIGQLDDISHSLIDVLERLGRFNYEIDPETLEVWDESLNHRGNITAVISRLRRYLKEQQG